MYIHRSHARDHCKQLLLQRKAKGAIAVSARAKEDLEEEEGRGTCDRVQRPVSRDRRALLSSRSSPPAAAARTAGGWTRRQPT